MVPVLAIAAPVRSEAPYLIEWIAYHRALGVQVFLLGDNGGEDGTSDLLQKLHRRGIIIRDDWLGQKYFHLAFLHQAIALSRAFAGGLFLIDVDEFIRPLDGQTSIRPLAETWIEDASIGAVAINWAIYGSCGREQPGEGLVIERFTGRAPQDCGINKHVKTFVRPDRCARPANNPHAVVLERGRYVDPAGKDVVWDAAVVPCGISREVMWERVRIDHFVLKSRMEFERKRARGSAMSPLTEEQRGNDGYFQAHDRNEVSDPMPEPLVAQTKSEIERILAAIS
jgi:O-antigen biosynthesis protein